MEQILDIDFKTKKMKKIAILVLVILINSCTSRDDSNEYRNIQLNVENLVVFEEQPTYAINDYVYFNADFSRYLPENGYSDLLDIYKTTNANSFIFGFSLHKKNAYGNWSEIDFGDNYDVVKGNIIKDYGVSGISILNNSTNVYEFKSGIKLLESGEFKLEVSTYFIPYNQVSNNNKTVYLSLFSTNNTINYSNEYIFTVD